jgi:uncharacterized protein YjdB/endonuclease I
MKHLFKTLIVGSLLSFALSLGVGAAIYSAPVHETGATVGSYTTNPSTYYSGISSSATGTTLGLALHNLMMTTHQTYTTYADVANYSLYTDTDPNNSANVICLYSGASVTGAWDSGNTWNREHVWCQSLSGGLWGTTGAGADFQHLRPSIPNINSTRGNMPFADLGHSGTQVQYNGSNTGSSYSGGCWEPRDAVKGDVARILMYVYTQYGTGFGGTTGTYTGPLNITDVVYTATGTAQAAWNLLLDWSTDDPVDSFEMARNNQAAVYQGNRNPFIDHPEYADRIWGTATTSFSMPSTLAVTVNGTGSAAGTVAGGTASSISYSVTSGSTYASVNSSTGLVTGLAVGSAVVTGTAIISGTTYTDTTTVTVSTLSVSSVTISPKPLTLTVGGTSALTATVSPSSVSQTVTWSSSATAIATVSSSGVVSAVAAGSATITATSTLDSTKTDTCVVTVNAAAASGEFQLCTSASDLVGGTDYVIGSASATSGYFMTTTPNTTNHYIPGESLTITSSRVTPSATTMIFTLGGTTGAYTFYSTNCTASQGYLDGTSTDSTYLAITAAASAGTTQQWTISIDSTGYSAAITCNGKTTRTALRWNSTSPRFSTYDTETSAIYNCYLYKRAAAVAVTSVSLAPTTLALNVGQTSILVATISPTNATNKAVTWSSNNNSIATVANGVVTAVAAGSATITVTTADGGHTATCAVTVTNVKTVLSISASNAPDLPFGSTTYQPTSSVSFVVTAYFNDNSSSTVTSTATYPTLSTFISTYNKVLGLHDLTVSYTDEQSVTVTTTVAVRTTNVGAVRSAAGTQTTTTVTSATASGGAITGWSGTVGSAYADGSVKFGTASNYYQNLSFFGSSDITSVTQIVFTIDLKQNGGTSQSSANIFTVNFTTSSGTTVFSKVLTGGTTTDDSGVKVFKTSETSYTFTMSNLTASSIRGVKLVYTTKNTGNIGLYSFSAAVTHGSAAVTYFTYQQQAEATRDFIQQYLTCSISETNLRQCVIEYNAMNVDDAGTNSKTIFATLLTTVNQYNYGSDDSFDYNQQTGEYTGNGPSGSTILVLTKLTYMTARYNTGKTDANKYYLYSDAYYANTDGNGSGTKVAPLLVDSAGRIINPTSAQSSLSITLIVVASTGVMTLLLIAGIYVFSRKKRKQI